MKVDEAPAGALNPAVRASIMQRLTPQAIMQQILPTSRTSVTADHQPHGDGETRQLARDRPGQAGGDDTTSRANTKASHSRHASQASTTRPTPKMGAHQASSVDGRMSPIKLPHNLSPEDFTRAVAAATVSALRHHGHASKQTGAGQSKDAQAHEEEEHAGHEGPSWSRAVSTGVLLGCTVMYAIIAGKSKRVILQDDSHPL